MQQAGRQRLGFRKQISFFDFVLICWAGTMEPKKRGFKSWVYKRINDQRKLIFWAAAGMAGLSLTLFLLQAGFFFILFAIAGYSFTTQMLVIVGLYGTMGLYCWNRSQQELVDRKHKAVVDHDTVKLSIAPATSEVWSWALGSMDSDRSIVEWISGILLIVPRLGCAAWYIWERVSDVHCIHEDTTLKVLKVLFRSEHAVRPQAIQDAIGEDDLVRAIRDISLLDGVVFLIKDDFTISIAPRLSDDLDVWRNTDEPRETTTGNVMR